MIAKLVDKGFEYNSKYDYLTGQFNGRDVIVSVVTNNNKVYRICVFDENYISEADIRIRFNNLYNQFLNNNKYMCADEEDCFIPEPEQLSDGISYQISVNKKRYQASFYQFPCDKQQYYMDYLEKNADFDNVSAEEFDAMTAEEKTNFLLPYVSKIMEEAHNRSVWFMIDEKYGKYRILMFYDNKLNESNGEDL